MTRLVEPLELGARTAPSRVMFGPHVTNLGDDERRLTDRHVAYYAQRAAGGAGVIVVEGASVHASDWPYERAPLAEHCAFGWAAIAAACHDGRPRRHTDLRRHARQHAADDRRRGHDLRQLVRIQLCRRNDLR